MKRSNLFIFFFVDDFYASLNKVTIPATVTKIDDTAF